MNMIRTPSFKPAVPPVKQLLTASASRGLHHRLMLAVSVAAAAGAIANGAFGEPAPRMKAVHQKVAEVHGNLPLTFVENQGQQDDRLRYYTQGFGYAFGFMADHVMITLHQSGAVSTGSSGGQSLALALRFLDSNAGVKVAGEKRAPGTVNYLRGSDPAEWRTGLASYRNVVYRELWPGIDMVLRGDEGKLKYEFQVRPGASHGAIRLAYAGVEAIALEESGGLRIETALGVLRDSPPVSWQEIRGKRTPVSSRYVLGQGAAFGFAVGEYDPNHVLVIDPGLDYSTVLGGQGSESVNDLAVDGHGNAYIVGHTTSTDFPTTPGAFDRTFNGGVMDVFVAKINSDGTSVLYATYLGGTPTPLRRGSESPIDFGYGITVDSQGHAYITGATSSSNFPTTSGSFQPNLRATDNTAIDAFVTKLTPSGGGLVYSTFLGGDSQDYGQSIAIDMFGNAYVAGQTCSENFPVTAGAFQTSRGAGCAAFITKLNATGSSLAYSSYLGGSDNSIAHSVQVDASGHAFVAGATRAEDFPTTPGAFMPAHPGGDFIDLFTGFVLKMTAEGSGLIYSTFLGGTKRDIIFNLVLDGFGHAYASGGTMSPEFPVTEGALDTAFTGTSEGFLTKLTPDGSGLVFSTFFGPAAGGSMALDPNNNIWLAGGTSRTDAFTTEDAFARENSGMSDAWFGLLSADGSELLFGSYFGGADNDGASGIALDPAGNVYIAGNTRSLDFPTTQGAPQITVQDQTAYVARFGFGTGVVNPPPPPPTETRTFSGSIGREQTLSASVSITATGPVDVSLTWNDSRVNLTLRALNPQGQVVFSDSGGSSPVTGTFQATVTGTYRLDIINTTRRSTTYTLVVTYPAGTTSFVPSLSMVRVQPTSVFGGESAVGDVILSSGAPPGGATVELVSSHPAVAPVPSSVTISQGNTLASFSIPTSTVQANTGVTISGTYNGVTRTATLEVKAEGGPAVSTLTVAPNPVTGGEPATGTVTLTSPAPSGGSSVTLISSNTDYATVPPSVTVLEGQTSASFTISTSQVDFDSSSSITAAHGGESRWVILSIKPAGQLPPAATLSSVTVNPTSVTGGTASQGTVALTSPAPSGGAVVALATSNSSVSSIPPSVTVVAGDTSASFTVTTAVVSAQTTLTITASLDGVTRTASLTVNPASTGPLPAPSLLSPADDARFSPGQSITFDWTDVPGASTYTLQIDDSRDFTVPLTLERTVESSVFTTSTLPTTRMWWRVRANDSAGNPGAWSASRRFEVK
jgi:hypothetical protein